MSKSDSYVRFFNHRSGVYAVSEVIIQVRDNGSLRVTGPVKLLDAEGNEFEPKAAFSLCRCGHSNNKPYCDGSHKTVEFHDECRAK